MMTNDAVQEFENKVLNEEIRDRDGNILYLHDPYECVAEQHISSNERRDSFFKCLSYGLYHKHGKYKQLRAELLLHFVYILFLNPEIKTVQDCIDYKVEQLVLHDNALRHPAIQMWVHRMHIANARVPYTPDEWIKSDKHSFFKSAQLFLEFHLVTGRLSCKYTFAYLMADKYGLHIRFYEHIKDVDNVYGKVMASGWIHPPASLTSELIPPEAISTPRAIDSNTYKEEEESIRKQGYSLTLLHANRRFRLLLPRLRKTSAPRELSPRQRERLMQAGLKSLPKVVADYSLRVYSDDEKDGPTNNIVGYFEKPLFKGGKVHTHKLDEKTVVENRVYQIYPGQPRCRTFSFPKHHGLFLYVINGKKEAKLISYLQRESNYLYFPLPDGAKQLAVLLAKTEKEADTTIQVELGGVTVIK